MKPWFEKEADIIDFPAPKEKVIKMPSVAEYPDFITGVQDLQARQKQGQISQDSYDKLYTELIHRFMKKESFENPWFMREAPGDPGIMGTDAATDFQKLGQQVAGLPADTDPRLIDRISTALELAQQKDKKGGQQTMFKRTALALKGTGDSDLQKYYKEVARYMLGNGLTSNEITTIIKEIANDTCVRMEELKKPQNVLSRIIPTSTISLETSKYYRSLFGASEYGVGPGELLFATHSPSLAKEGKGDLKVIGDDTTREIEVKAKRKKPARFVDRSTFPTGDYMTMANNFIKKWKKIIPMAGDGATFNHIRSAIDKMQSRQREQVIREITPMVTSLFNSKKHTNKIVNYLFGSTYDESKLKAYWATACIERYFNSKQGGMGILFCRLQANEIQTNYAADYKSFASFAKVNQVGGIYIVSSNTSYPFPQTDIALQ